MTERRENIKFVARIGIAYIITLAGLVWLILRFAGAFSGHV